VLQPGDHVPHFGVRAVGGETVSYTTIWQRRHLVLITARDDDREPLRDAQLAERLAELPDTALVITTAEVPGLPPPAVLIADRWGEIVHVASATRTRELPDADEIADWISHIRTRCPECEGEAR
jgi:hypothetical protein